VFNHLVNYLNAQLNAETQNQAASNRHIFRVLGRLYTVSYFVGHPVSKRRKAINSECFSIIGNSKLFE